MKKPIISVIVPVYNVEKYLKNCLDSILNQTFSDIEIICVNDGSTDKSRKILEEYKNQDCRIKIVDKENGGLSSARNAGYKVAQGEFISYIDSDDWVDNTMLEKLYKSMTAYNTDITICAVHQYDESKGKIDDSNPYYTLGFFNETFDDRAFSYKDTKPFIMDVCVMAWNKLYRKSFIDECKAEFPEGLIFEDGPFFFSIFFKTSRVSIVRDFLYYYRINRKGSIIQEAGKKYLNLIDVIELMYNSIKVIPDFEDVKYTFWVKKSEDLIFRFENLKFKYKFAFAEKIRKQSSLANREIFPPSMVKKDFKYNYFLLCNLINSNILLYDIKKFRRELVYKRMNVMYRIMDILYREQGYFVLYLRKKNKEIKFKKRADIFDVYYDNDKLVFTIFRKFRFKIPFNYTEIERFNNEE